MALAQAAATVTIKSGYGWVALPGAVGTVIERARAVHCRPDEAVGW